MFPHGPHVVSPASHGKSNFDTLPTTHLKTMVAAATAARIIHNTLLTFLDLDPFFYLFTFPYWRPTNFNAWNHIHQAFWVCTIQPWLLLKTGHNHWLIWQLLEQLLLKRYWELQQVLTQCVHYHWKWWIESRSCWLLARGYAWKVWHILSKLQLVIFYISTVSTQFCFCRFCSKRVFL